MPEHPLPKLRMLSEAIREAREVPDLSMNARLAADSFLATVAANDCSVDRHTSVMISRVIRGLVELKTTST